MIKKETIIINNIAQGYIMCEQNKKAPVILYLHGGPGSPEYPIFQSQLNASYLCEFNICYYDHRGCGLSFNKKSKLSLDLLIEDVLDITKHLIKKYNKKNIILVAHSFGTYLGIKAVQAQPEYYSSYIGISQITNVKESERRIYDDLLKVCKEKKDYKGKRLLKKNTNSVKKLSNHYMKNVKGRLLKRYQIGLTRKPLPTYFIIGKIFSFPLYSLKNKLEYCKGLIYSSRSLFPMTKEINLFQNSYNFKIPIYFIHGIYDYQISRSLVNEYFEKLKSPKKELIIFEESAHFPNFEEPDKFNKIITSLCNT
ncbi:alpha/beta fold hydrolase [Lysinibacillus sp. LZ02]|uniref:alpha/beta fold hydrolase n=1 Tax=Lysinibacillus sp. LZ02 TaxID=3420668 RepID=UPI003D3613CC